MPSTNFPGPDHSFLVHFITPLFKSVGKAYFSFMHWMKALLTSKYFYLSIAACLLSAALLLYSFDRWVMPAYTNFSEGVTVPDVTKLALTEAESTLDLYGLRYEVLDRRAHSAYPADYILDQTPSPRQIVKPNRKIYLTVNTAERPTVVVPNVVNMSLRNAQIQLENYGLTRGTISYESSRFRNTVLRQSVASGDTVDQGTVIDLAVSDGLGDEMVDVPDIHGFLLSEAQQKLREAGLRIRDIRFQPSRDVSPNTILSISHDNAEIQPGEQLREGESLDLVVSERFDAREESEAGAVIDDEEQETQPENQNQSQPNQ